MPLICQIYKSAKKDEMYLYVEKKDGLKRVPEALLQQFGKPIEAMVLLLKPERELAQADISKVMDGIKMKGFYLQMPPPKDDYMLNLHKDRPESGVR